MNKRTAAEDLATWIRASGENRMGFAFKCGVSLGTVDRWCQGTQRPSRRHSTLIFQQTGGAVDFRQSPEGEQAETSAPNGAGREGRASVA